MDQYFRKLHEDRAAPGLERVIWRKLPMALLGSVFVPLAMSVAMRVMPPDSTVTEIAKATKIVDFFALGLALTSVTAVFTVAIGCVIVMIMKGPAYVADPYELNEADGPVPHRKTDID